MQAVPSAHHRYAPPRPSHMPNVHPQTLSFPPARTTRTGQGGPKWPRGVGEETAGPTAADETCTLFSSAVANFHAGCERAVLEVPLRATARRGHRHGGGGSLPRRAGTPVCPCAPPPPTLILAAATPAGLALLLNLYPTVHHTPNYQQPPPHHPPHPLHSM